MLNPDFRDMLSALCDQQVEFMVVGAYALAAYGLPALLETLTCGFVALMTMPRGFGAQFQTLERR